MSFDITASSEWAALQQHFEANKSVTLRERFAADPNRAASLTFDGGNLHVDLSKNLADAETFAKLIDVATAADLPAKIEAMYTGERINLTENRSVLHTALRLPVEEDFKVEDQDVAADVQL